VEPRLKMGDRAIAKGWGCCAPFRGEVTWVPIYTMWPVPRLIPPFQVASWSIEQFGHNTPALQTDRTDRQTGQRSDSTWPNRFTDGCPTNVAPKLSNEYDSRNVYYFYMHVSVQCSLCGM